MKKAIGILVIVMITLAVSGALASEFLKISSFQTNMEKAVANLEKLFMNDRLVFTGQGRQLYIDAWKLCQKYQKYPSAGSMTHLAISTARDNLDKVTENLDTLVYDQLVTFKDDNAKQLYRQSLKNIRQASSLL